MKKESLILGQLLKKIAPRIGAKVFLEPVWGVAGQITFKSGAKSYFRYNTVDLNPIGASDIAKDKDYANLFMARMGYPIVPGSKTFFSDRFAKSIGAQQRKITDAYRYAEKLGFPVVVKPNSGSQGSAVALAHTKTEFYRAMRAVFERDNVALVQKAVSGKDYRIVVLDSKVISAYERIPLSVLGDGRSTIAKLLKIKERQFRTANRDTQIDLADPRMKEKLQHQDLTLKSIPKNGERIYLLDNANLSTGGDSVDVTPLVHKDFQKIAVRLTKDMGLRLCGVDLMIDGDIGQKPEKYWVLEINAAPGLDHYAKTGKKQEKIVEDLYLQVLKSIEK